jgi:hypothetical protein
MSTDSKGTKILARTFFNQLRASGYNSNQIIGVATELIDLVTSDLKERSGVRAAVAQAPGTVQPQPQKPRFASSLALTGSGLVPGSA